MSMARTAPLPSRNRGATSESSQRFSTSSSAGGDDVQSDTVGVSQSRRSAAVRISQGSFSPRTFSLGTSGGQLTAAAVRSLTPTSRQALWETGILPSELVFRPLSAFQLPHLPRDIARLRFEEAEKQRQYVLDKARLQHSCILRANAPIMPQPVPRLERPTPVVAASQVQPDDRDGDGEQARGVSGRAADSRQQQQSSRSSKSRYDSTVRMKSSSPSSSGAATASRRRRRRRSSASSNASFSQRPKTASFAMTSSESMLAATAPVESWSWNGTRAGSAFVSAAADAAGARRILVANGGKSRDSSYSARYRMRTTAPVGFMRPAGDDAGSQFQRQQQRPSTTMNIRRSKFDQNVGRGSRVGRAGRNGRSVGNAKTSSSERAGGKAPQSQFSLPPSTTDEERAAATAAASAHHAYKMGAVVPTLLASPRSPARYARLDGRNPLVRGIKHVKVRRKKADAHFVRAQRRFEVQAAILLHRQDEHLAHLAGLERRRFELEKMQRETRLRREARVAKEDEARRAKNAEGMDMWLHKLQEVERKEVAAADKLRREQEAAAEKHAANLQALREKEAKVLADRARADQILIDAARKRRMEADAEAQGEAMQLKRDMEQRLAAAKKRAKVLKRADASARAERSEVKLRRTIAAAERVSAEKEDRLHIYLAKQDAAKQTADELKKLRAEELQLRRARWVERRSKALGMKDKHAEEQARLAQVVAEKDAASARLLVILDQEKREYAMLLHEQNRLEEDRAARNLARLRRREEYHRAELIWKIQQDDLRIEELARAKREFAERRKRFQKQMFIRQSAFKKMLDELRVHGAAALQLIEQQQKEAHQKAIEAAERAGIGSDNPSRANSALGSRARGATTSSVATQATAGGNSTANPSANATAAGAVIPAGSSASVAALAAAGGGDDTEIV